MSEKRYVQCCVFNYTEEEFLTEGKIYEVHGISPERDFLITGDDGNQYYLDWNAGMPVDVHGNEVDQFKRYVKCIHREDEEADAFTVGKVYEVKIIHDHFCQIWRNDFGSVDTLMMNTEAIETDEKGNPL